MSRPRQGEIFIELTASEKLIVDLLGSNESMHVDFLSHQVSLSGSQLAAALLNLEFNGIITSLPGKMYKLG